MTALTDFCAQHGLTNATPAFTKSAGRADLAGLFAAMGYKTGAEIGVWQGHYSTTLCQQIPGLHLTCVDPWKQYKTYNEAKNNQERLDDAYRQTVEALAPFGCDIWRMTSLAAAAQVPDASLDFVYIDANHQEPFVSQDLNAWAPKVRPGGIVAGHDYHLKPKKPFLQEVKPAVDAFTRAHQIHEWYVLMRDKAPSFFWVVPA